ncbi:unnamed protein product [Haemonchus placei]|uniref:Transcriptional regulator n=1 Tax=Haemonchus placei TaxID=6290 RepID=A0A0N4WB01_HAEPC|nr:unnamed protein product [Haemonchus placei]
MRLALPLVVDALRPLADDASCLAVMSRPPIPLEVCRQRRLSTIITSLCLSDGQFLVSFCRQHGDVPVDI